jgi:hypothetical protein
MEYGTQEHWDLWGALVRPYNRALKQLKVGDLDGVEDALRYLETRPRFQGSGYLAEDLIRVLARCELSATDRARFRQALESITTEQPSRRELGLAQRVLARPERPST